MKAVDAYHVLVAFSEAVDPGFAGNSIYYRIEKPGGEPLGVLSVSTSGTRQAILSTPPMSVERYDLSVQRMDDLQGNSANDLTASFNGSVEEDRTPPAITMRSPAPGETGVPLGSSVEIFFSEAVQLLHSGNATITTGGETVPIGIVGQGDYGHYLLYVPIERATTYTVTISGVQDFAGNTLPVSTWSFTSTDVPDTTPPTVVAWSPSDNESDVPLDRMIMIEFSEMIDRESFAPVISPSVDRTPEWWPNGKEFRLWPPSPLSADTEYVITIPAGGMKDVAGNANPEPYTITFSTAPAAAPVRP